MIREHEVARWLMAAITVAAAHIGGIWAAASWQPAAPAPDMLEPAAVIELAALTLAPEAPWQEVAPGPQMAQAAPEKPPEPIEESVEEPELTQPEPAKAPQPEPPAELPAIPAAAAVLAPPKPLPPRMKPERKAPQKSAQRQPRRPREIAQQQRLTAPQTSAPISMEAARAERAAAPEMGSSAAGLCLIKFVHTV